SVLFERASRMLSPRVSTSFPSTTWSASPCGAGSGVADLCFPPIPKNRSSVTLLCARVSAQQNARNATAAKTSLAVLIAHPQENQTSFELFVTNCFHRIQPRRFHGRISPKNQSNRY